MVPFHFPAHAFQEKWLPEAKNLFMIILGIAIYSIGFTAFLLPHQIVIGGMAGVSTLVYYATFGKIPIAVALYGGNILLLICGYKYLGKGFVMRTIFGASVVAILIGAFEGYFTSHPPLVKDAPMSMAMGAVLLGIGIGIYYAHNGTTGGTDIVAAVMSKISTVSVGRVMMIVDISVVACSFFLPFDGDLQERIQDRTQSIIYGWVAIFIYSFIADKFIYQGKQTVQFIILSDKWENVGKRITCETGRGVTTWDGKGYWTGADRKLMIVWCRQMQTHKILEIIHEEDPSAYVTNSLVKSVYGNGFDVLKPKTHGLTQNKKK